MILTLDQYREQILAMIESLGTHPPEELAEYIVRIMRDDREANRQQWNDRLENEFKLTGQRDEEGHRFFYESDVLLAVQKATTDEQ